jgi:hypothetical protein
VTSARRPDFLVIGAPKAGTTSLFRYLSSHPHVHMPERKELSFFVAELNWRQGLDWYLAQFVGADGAKAVGEASPTYAWHPSYPRVPERIAGVLPDVRLIYLVRHPIERMRSMYLHAVVLGRERRPLSRALLETPDYLDCSRYATQLEQYLRHFPRERILVLRSEDLRDRRRETVERALSFIGADPALCPTDLEVEEHRARDRLGGRACDLRVPAPLEERLVELLHPELERLRVHCGESFDAWGLL